MPAFDFIFSLLSLIFSFQSISSSNKFLKSKDPSLFAAAKSKKKTFLVFFVLVCFKLVVELIMLFFIVSVMMNESETEEIGYIIGFFSFTGIFTIVTFIVGIIAMAKFSEANKAFIALVPPAIPSEFPQNFNGFSPNGANYNYTNKNNDNLNNCNTNYNGAGTRQIGYQSNLYTNDPAKLRSSTADQSPFEAPPPNYSNYNYKNTISYQQPKKNTAPDYYAQQSNRQPISNTANYDQIVSNPANSVSQNMAAPPEKNVTPVILPVSPKDSEIQAKKETAIRCMHCGVTNNAEDKFCTFCGKSLSE